MFAHSSVQKIEVLILVRVREVLEEGVEKLK
jgi:hypothetical protein